MLFQLSHYYLMCQGDKNEKLTLKINRRTSFPEPVNPKNDHTSRWRRPLLKVCTREAWRSPACKLVCSFLHRKVEVLSTLNSRSTETRLHARPQFQHMWRSIFFHSYVNSLWSSTRLPRKQSKKDHHEWQTRAALLTAVTVSDSEEVWRRWIHSIRAQMSARLTWLSPLVNTAKFIELRFKSLWRSAQYSSPINYSLSYVVFFIAAVSGLRRPSHQFTEPLNMHFSYSLPLSPPPHPDKVEGSVSEKWGAPDPWARPLKGCWPVHTARAV